MGATGSFLVESTNVLVAIGAAVAASYVIGRAVWSVYRFVKRLELIHTTILAELIPNGGFSIKDQIGRIDKRLERLELAQVSSSDAAS